MCARWHAEVIAAHGILVCSFLPIPCFQEERGPASRRWPVGQTGMSGFDGVEKPKVAGRGAVIASLKRRQTP